MSQIKAAPLCILYVKSHGFSKCKSREIFIFHHMYNRLRIYIHPNLRNYHVHLPNVCGLPQDQTVHTALLLFPGSSRGRLQMKQECFDSPLPAADSHLQVISIQFSEFRMPFFLIVDNSPQHTWYLCVTCSFLEPTVHYYGHILIRLNYRSIYVEKLLRFDHQKCKGLAFLSLCLLCYSQYLQLYR